MAVVRTGAQINPLLKKVVDGGPHDGEALDVNNQLCSVTGLPQATMATPTDDPLYRQDPATTLDCSEDGGGELTLRYTNTQVHTMTSFFIYDIHDKGYTMTLDLIDSASTYGNHTVSSTLGPIASPSSGNKDNHAYDDPNPGTIGDQIYIATGINISINAPEEDPGGSGGFVCGCSMGVRKLFTDFPSITEARFKITTTKNTGPDFQRTTNIRRHINTAALDNGTNVASGGTPAAFVMTPIVWTTSFEIEIKLVKTSTDFYDIYYDFTST